MHYKYFSYPECWPLSQACTFFLSAGGWCRRVCYSGCIGTGNYPTGSDQYPGFISLPVTKPSIKNKGGQVTDRVLYWCSKIVNLWCCKIDFCTQILNFFFNDNSRQHTAKSLWYVTDCTYTEWFVHVNDDNTIRNCVSFSFVTVYTITSSQAQSTSNQKCTLLYTVLIWLSRTRCFLHYPEKNDQWSVTSRDQLLPSTHV